MTNFTAFDVLAFAVEAFQDGGSGVTQRRGGKVPWWAKREWLERLLEEERRLARERARARTPEEARVVAQAKVLLDSLTIPERPKRVIEPPKPKPVAEPLTTRLMGPFQHLLQRPAPVETFRVRQFNTDEIIDAIEAVEEYERSLEHA